MYIGVHRGQRGMSAVLLIPSSAYSLRQGLLLNQKLADSSCKTVPVSTPTLE